MDRNENVHNACCRLFEEVEVRKNFHNHYALPYANYIMSWSSHLPIHTIIIGQNPYPQKIHSEFGAAFSYDQSKSLSPPKTVQVLAFDIYNYDKTNIELSMECFRDSWRLLEIGVILINETVFDKLLHTKNNLRGNREMEAQIRALQVVISESFLLGQEVITCIGMGIPAACMTSVLRPWCPSDLIKMKTLTCRNPAARDIGDVGSHTVTLGKPAVSKVLSRIVKLFSDMAPSTTTPAQKRRDQNIKSLKQHGDNVSITGDVYTKELETLEERLRPLTDESSVNTTTLNEIISSCGSLRKAITNHTNAIASTNITLIMMVESAAKELSGQGTPKPIDDKLLSPATPQRSGPRRRVVRKTTPVMDSVEETVEITPEIVVEVPEISYTPSPAPSRSRRRVPSRRVTQSDLGSEYTMDVASNGNSDKDKDITVIERTHINSFAGWCKDNMKNDPVYSEILNAAADDLSITNPLTAKVVEYIRERKAADPEYDAYDELTDPNSATSEWAKANIQSN